MDGKIKVFIEKCNEKAIIPTYANVGDAGMDVYSVEDITIGPGETKIVHTGIKLAIPFGYEIQVRPRSGISYKTPLRVPNSPGTIDSGYREELGIIMSNISTEDTGTYRIDTKGNKQGKYEVKAGDRIAQIILNRVPQIEFEEVNDVKDIGANRGGGFGSTGV